MTKEWKLEADAPEVHPVFAEAGGMLAQGGLVAFPTETVYGLGADARNPQAVEAIFAAKGRPSDNPLIVHIADPAQIGQLVEAVDATSLALMDALWPGPLTLVLPVKTDAVCSQVTAGLDTVAVRMPDHPIALKLIRAAGCPVAAPSANRSGRPSPTTAAHVREDLAGKIAGIIDGGAAGVGLESTVVAVEAEGALIRVLRPGGVTVSELRRAAPGVEVAVESVQEVAGGTVPRSPGMKYAHYAPQGTMIVVRGESQHVLPWVRERLAAAAAKGERTGILTVEDYVPYCEADVVIGCGSKKNVPDTAKQLYDALRRFDEAGATFILAFGFETEEEIGLAVMNRLYKAAGQQVVYISPASR